MPAPYNAEIRRNVLDAIAQGMSYSKAAAHLRVSRRWVGTIVRQYRATGDCSPRSWNEGPAPVLGEREQRWIADWLTADATLTQMRLKTLLVTRGVFVSVFTVARTLKRMGWVRVDRRWRPRAEPMDEVTMLHASAG